MVRLKSAYIIKCDEVIKDASGKVTELHCSYIPESKSGSDVSGIHVKGVIHWVSVKDAVPVEIRLYDRLFSIEDPAVIEEDFLGCLNPDSLRKTTAYAEPELLDARPGAHYQFLRLGYFCVDTDSINKKPVFNRTVTLRDMWAKESKK